MWISGDVELPDEVIEAHENGELVFFVGAGASVDAPSNLPLFDRLAAMLADKAAYSFPSAESLDFLLGQLEALPQGFDVHQHTREIVSDPKSKFNRLHQVIVDLAGVGRTFRIVTTNYDDHLASAASDGSIAIPETWYAPALPLGNDFAGLVYLHGSVKQSKEKMILTDRDFGRAYLTAAWAARFLLPMFDRFTVVFIGYSHDDLIMRYLALGLPSREKDPTPKRFVFTSDPSNDKWQYLGIQPINYPVFENDHSALLESLESWLRRVKMGRTDHRSRTEEIVRGGTMMPLPDRDYLRSRLRTSDGVRDFEMVTVGLSDEAKLDWLSWIDGIPEFKNLFSSSITVEGSAILTNWFGKLFIASPALNGAALQTIQRHGQTMTSSMFSAAWEYTHYLVEQDVANGKRWQAILASSIHGQSAPIDFSFSLEAPLHSTVPNLAVLRAALRPYLQLKQRWSVRGAGERSMSPDAEISWMAGSGVLAEYLTRTIELSEPGDQALGSVLESAIVGSYDLLVAYQGEMEWDPLAFHRSAIEKHPQDWLWEPLDAVIDALRDYGVRALPVRPGLPDQWWAHDFALMRRLALHLIAVDPSRSADDKLAWLLDRTGLYAKYLKHETYHILRVAVPEASPPLKERILDAVATGPCYSIDDDDRERLEAYATYNLLAWLTQADPNWVEAKSEFDEIQDENSDFGVRKHPDLDRWMSSGTWSGELPMEIEEFLQELSRDANAALRDLLLRDYSTPGVHHPQWSEALRLVRQAAELRPDLAVPLWDAISDHVELEERRPELWQAVCEGWGRADLDGCEIEAINRLQTLLPDKNSVHSVARFLQDQIHRHQESGDSPLLSRMREVAESVWAAHAEDFKHSYGSEVLTHAPLYLNSWPGLLALFWNGEIGRRWLHSGEKWEGLNDQENTALLAMLTGSNFILDATQPAIAGRLYFYFSADSNFAQLKLLPIFNDRQRHLFGWVPYLDYPRCDDRILAAGLFESMVGEAERLDELPKSSQVAFLRLVASVLSSASITSGQRSLLLNQVVLASDGYHSVHFAEIVFGTLQDGVVDAAEIWRTWLGKHLSHRVNGVPRIASSEELEWWAEVVPYVGEFVPTATEVLSGHGIGIGNHFVTWEFPDQAFLDYGVELVEFYVELVRNTSVSDLFCARRIRKLIQRVKEATGDDLALPLVKLAMEMGFIRDDG